MNKEGKGKGGNAHDRAKEKARRKSTSGKAPLTLPTKQGTERIDVSAEIRPDKSLSQKLWTFVENPITQGALGVTVVLVGALHHGQKILIVVAWVLFGLSIFRTQFFESKRWRIAANFAVCLLFAIVLGAIYRHFSTTKSEVAPPPEAKAVTLPSQEPAQLAVSATSAKPQRKSSGSRAKAPKAKAMYASVPTSSIVRNAGEIGDLQISNSTVAANPGEHPEIVDNRSGAVLNRAKIENSEVSTVTPSVPVHAGAIFSYGNGAKVEISNAIFCGQENALVTAGKNGDVNIHGAVMNNAKVCAWMHFLKGVLRHKEDLGSYLSGWKRKQEAAWGGLPVAKVSQYRESLENVRTQLVNDASSDYNSFYDAVRKRMFSDPPDFDITQPE